MREMLRHWGKKDYPLLKADYVCFPCCYYSFLKKCFIVFCGANVSFMRIVWSVVPSYVVPSEAPCAGDLLWLL